jgi:trk system potassium uptake protein TrkH
MKQLAFVRLLAIICGVVTLLLLPSLAAALLFGEFFMVRAFAVPVVTGLLLSLAAFVLIPKSPLSVNRRNGPLMVFLTWIFASLTGAIPYYFSPANISVAEAIFESCCGFSTTGATTLPDVESLPRSLIFWRSMSHWAGGMGIVLLTVALLPILGIGGFQLLKAEAPGPEKEKLKPRVTTTAKTLWYVYCIFTVILALLYRLGGMEWFDAICHSFTLISTGGVSTKNNGFGFYDSPYIDWVTVIFMLLGAMNFNMYYRIIKGKFRDLVQNTEVRVYFSIFFIAALAVSVNLVSHYGSFGEALRFGSFQAASFISSTGNVRVDYTGWPNPAQGVLFCLMFIGGCSSSTAGGIKVIRHVILFKQTGNELRRILYPQGVFSIHLNRKIGRKDVVYGAAGFVFLYFTLVAVTALVTTAAGFDIFSSFCTALSVIGNIGASFGAASHGNNFSVFPDYLKLFYSLLMIAGRLELWTVFVIFSPEFWRY